MLIAACSHFGHLSLERSEGFVTSKLVVATSAAGRTTAAGTTTGLSYDFQKSIDPVRRDRVCAEDGLEYVLVT